MQNAPRFGTKKENMSSYLAEHMWRLKVRQMGQDYFMAFVDDCARMFNPTTCNGPGGSK